MVALYILYQIFDFNSFFSLVIALTLGLGGIFIVYIISGLISPRKKYAMKKERFECANPAMGKARGWFMMQYYGYLIVFLTVEPIMIFFFLLMLADRIYFLNSVTLLISILLILFPALIFGLDAAKKLDLWKSE